MTRTSDGNMGQQPLEHEMWRKDDDGNNNNKYGRPREVQSKFLGWEGNLDNQVARVMAVAHVYQDGVHQERKSTERPNTNLGD